jgi:hypothetical protein
MHTLGRANTQVRPYENDLLGRGKLDVGADLCVCPDCRRLSDDTQKNKPDKYVIMDAHVGLGEHAGSPLRQYEMKYLCHTILIYITVDLFE